ncbi:MAG TPA: sulfite exporter TauE/SafE family protein [Bryobacteraceae bacterium]|jgi:ABC-type nickel/cobalt efflux system permease component RcnA
MPIRQAISLLICAAPLFAHPMGNFSVSHYAKLQATARGVTVRYVLDLAEIPTFELLHAWKLERSSPQPELEIRAAAQAREWLNNLVVTGNSKRLHATLKSARLVIADGAGGLPIMRITAEAHIQATSGTLTYEDRNYPDRAGWKEIVIEGAAGVTLRKVSQTSADLSKALTQYPPDPTIAPPQDLRAKLEWSITGKPVSQPDIARIAQPHSVPAAPAPATMTARAAPPGAVVRGDFLSRLLRGGELTPWMLLIAIGSAFVLGAGHALTPGHGKTIVAAYLVGSRGTLRHAAFLGAMVTFTHTIAVFALGLATLFLFRYIVPEKITQALGVISGLCIVFVGSWMLYKRTAMAGHTHAHGHDHGGHDHHHHEHAHDHHHHHHHNGDHHQHEHHHHGHAHSHVPDELSWGSLVVLGASGGLVPCESALVLLLGAVAIGRVGLGLLLLVSFSLGLALVLMLIGVVVLYARNLLPETKRTAASSFFRWVSIASPAVVIVVGLVMTGVSLRWIEAKWLIG